MFCALWFIPRSGKCRGYSFRVQSKIIEMKKYAWLLKKESPGKNHVQMVHYQELYLDSNMRYFNWEIFWYILFAKYAHRGQGHAYYKAAYQPTGKLCPSCGSIISLTTWTQLQQDWGHILNDIFLFEERIIRNYLGLLFTSFNWWTVYLNI